MTREEPPFALLDRPIHLIQHLSFLSPFTRPSIRDIHPFQLDQRLSRPCGRTLGTDFVLAPERASLPVEPFLFEGGSFSLARFEERPRFRSCEDVVFWTEEEAVVRSVDVVDVGESEMGHKGRELVLRSEDEEDTR